MITQKLLDTSNRLCYVYISEGLQVEILGGIRVEIMDRLRVTVKLSNGVISLRHNLENVTVIPIGLVIYRTVR